MGWYFDGPLVIVLLLSFATGAIAAFLTILPGTVRKSLEISKLKTRLLACEHKLALQEQQSLQQREASAPSTGATTL
jgi:hypothetical protein